MGSGNTRRCGRASGVCTARAASWTGGAHRQHGAGSLHIGIRSARAGLGHALDAPALQHTGRPGAVRRLRRGGDAHVACRYTDRSPRRRRPDGFHAPVALR